MAVTITQMSKDIARRRASTVPSDRLPYNPSEIVAMPLPEQYHYNSSAGRSSNYMPYNSLRRPTSNQRAIDSTYRVSIPSAVQPYLSYYNPPSAFKQCSPPAPVKGSSRDPSSDASSPQLSEHSSSNGSTGSYSRSSIEPDPLPPHSNPQALSQSQSEAFFGSKPIAPLRVGRDEVWNSHTGFADFSIAREDGKILPSFISTKPRINVIKTSTGLSMGHIRFHTMTSNKIELAVNGRETSISHTGLVHNRWGFQSTTCPNDSETWYWKKDKDTGGAILEDAKRSGNVLAKMKGNSLTFQTARLSQDSYEEIVVSAIAMAEAARRQKRKSDVVDIASVIGDFMSSDGMHVIESGGYGGSWG